MRHKVAALLERGHRVRILHPIADRHLDRQGRRRWHAAQPAALTATWRPERCVRRLLRRERRPSPWRIRALSSTGPDRVGGASDPLRDRTALVASAAVPAPERRLVEVVATAPIRDVADLAALLPPWAARPVHDGGPGVGPGTTSSHRPADGLLPAPRRRPRRRRQAEPRRRIPPRLMPERTRRAASPSGRRAARTGRPARPSTRRRSGSPPPPAARGRRGSVRSRPGSGLASRSSACRSTPPAAG